MSTNYSLLFYLKKSKNYVSGDKPIYMRITINGSAKEVSTGRSCEPSKWNSRANRAKGNKEEVKTLNSYLDTLTHKIAENHLQLLKHGEKITAEKLKLKYLGKDIKRNTLVSIFIQHNRNVKTLLGNGFKINTLKGYTTSLSHIQCYLKKQYQLADIDVRQIDHAFIAGYEFFIRTELGCSAISAAKYIKHLRKIINLCIAHRWISENPFAFYKSKAKPKQKEFLSQFELECIEQRIFSMIRLCHVRDIFVFCCYTGLSYADVKKLTKKDITHGINGRLWILTSREKTETTSNIPLLPKPWKL